MKRQFAISDIHGCLRTFEALLDQIAFSKADELYLLGDYVDRGPDSKGVIDKIWHLQSEGYLVKCLAGNHERVILDSERIERIKGWQGLGHDTFLESFGVKKLYQVPQEYFDWMANLPYHFEIPGFILVHAGIDSRSENPLENPNVLLWARNWYEHINYDWLEDRIIIHGHTPMYMDEIKTMQRNIAKKRVIDIDAGCVTIVPPRGHLCTYNMTDDILHFVQSLE
jgi:serine/threonine protein phosphatase 1